MVIALTRRMTIAGAGASLEEARSRNVALLRNATIPRIATVLRIAVVLRTVAVLRREVPTQTVVLVVVECDQRTRTYVVEGGE